MIDIVAFVPQKSVDPIFYDKAYLLAPDKRGDKPYALLMEAMRKSGRCALARWSWKSKQYVVQVRAVEDGLVLQQLLYADEVRSLKDLGIEQVSVSDAELKLALQLIDQIAQDTFDPEQFNDEEKGRILAAIDEKIAGKQIVAPHRTRRRAAGPGDRPDGGAARKPGRRWAQERKHGAAAQPRSPSDQPAPSAPRPTTRQRPRQHQPKPSPPAANPPAAHRSPQKRRSQPPRHASEPASEQEEDRKPGPISCRSGISRDRCSEHRSM